MATREFVHRRSAVPGVSALYGYAADGLAEGLHRGIPSRGLTFIVSMDDPVEGADGPEEWEAGRIAAFDTLVAGLHTRPTYVRQPSCQRGIQISVHPLAARAILGVPAAELEGRTWRAEDVLGERLLRLRERLHEMPTWEMRFDAVEDFLRPRSDVRPARHRPRPEIAAAWRSLAATHGGASVRALARSTCLSERQLGVIVRREFGVTPRELAGLMRFDAAFADLTAAVRAGRRPLLADVAAATGYYDQAHFTREFRRYTGIPPGAFVGEEIANIQAGGHRRGTDSEP